MEYIRGRLIFAILAAPAPGLAQAVAIENHITERSSVSVTARFSISVPRGGEMACDYRVRAGE